MLHGKKANECEKIARETFSENSLGSSLLHQSRLIKKNLRKNSI